LPDRPPGLRADARVRRRPPRRLRGPPEDGLRPPLVPGNDDRGRQVRAWVLASDRGANRKKLLKASSAAIEVAGMSPLDRLQRIGTQENDVELFVLGVCPLGLSVGRLGSVVVGAERLDIGLAGGQVVTDQEVFDVLWAHRLLSALRVSVRVSKAITRSASA